MICQFVMAELARRKHMSKGAAFARRVLGKDADNLALIRTVADHIRSSQG